MLPNFEVRGIIASIRRKIVIIHGAVRLVLGIPIFLSTMGKSWVAGEELKVSYILLSIASKGALLFTICP